MINDCFSAALLNAAGGVDYPLVPATLQAEWSEHRGGRVCRDYTVEKCVDERGHLLWRVQTYIRQRQAQLCQDCLESARHRKDAAFAANIVAGLATCMQPYRGYSHYNCIGWRACIPIARVLHPRGNNHTLS